MESPHFQGIALAAGLFVACSTPSEKGPAPDAAPHSEPWNLNASPERACASCHPNHVDEWRISPHAYAMRDPVLHAMIRVGQRETQGELGDFCVQCHAPMGVVSGETDVFFDENAGEFAQRTQGLSAGAEAGVSCDVCHSIADVEDTFNAGFVLSLDGVRRATIRNPAPAPHEAGYSPLHADADLCGTCHQVINDRDVPLERTYMEWVMSRYNGAQSCQRCHMPGYDGQAAAGGEERFVHRHTFVGVDVSLLPEDEFPGYTEMRELTTALLKESAALSAVAVPAERLLDVTVENLAGHKLPSGAVADREMWIETFVRDASGNVVFESGTLDERGDLRTDDPNHTTRPGTDPQLVLYSQKMFFDPALEDPASTEPRRRVEFLWEPNAEESHLVPAGGVAKPSYDLSALPPGDYAAELRLLFRSFPPHLLRLLEEKGDLDPDVKTRVPLVEMTRTSVTFTF